MSKLILAVNPGSTSTKFALVENDEPLFIEIIKHDVRKLSEFKRVSDQFEYRKKLILKKLEEQGVNTDDIKAVVGRGGLLKPIESGVYSVNERMREDLLKGVSGEHASNLGGLISWSLASSFSNAIALIVDPVVVDELQDVARISGHPSIKRISIFHALNQKAVARFYADSIGRKYEDLNLIIAHMGGGISVGAHCKGRVVDVNNGYNGEGPLAPERSGGLPSGQLADLCFSGKYTHEEVLRMLTGEGGMVAYLGTNDFREVCRRAENGEDNAILIRDAVAYQCGKEIGALSAVLEGDVDAIILTGGLAHQEDHNDRIKKMVSHISEVIVYAGEDELKSLSFNGRLALDGIVEIKEYA